MVVHYTWRGAISAEAFRPSCSAIGPTDPLALTLRPTRQTARPPARLQQGHVALVQIRQSAGTGPNILEEASETEDTNCDVTT